MTNNYTLIMVTKGLDTETTHKTLAEAIHKGELAVSRLDTEGVGGLAEVYKVLPNGDEKLLWQKKAKPVAKYTAGMLLEDTMRAVVGLPTMGVL